MAIGKKNGKEMSSILRKEALGGYDKSFESKINEKLSATESSSENPCF